MPHFELVSFSGDQRFELAGGRTHVVGRAVSSDIPIFDPTISRRHAEIVPEDDGVVVRDLGSSNGTFINGVRVTEGRLGVNDSITFGKVVYHLRTNDPATGRSAPSAFPPPGGTIVRQMAVRADAPAKLDGGGGTSGVGQLKVVGADQKERQAKKLSLLLDISQKLSGEFDLDRLLGTVVETTFEIMNVDRVSILLRNESSGDLVPKVSRSRLGDATSLRVPRSIAHKVVEERVAIQSDNAAADERFKGQSILLQSVRSAMCSPLMDSNDRVLGIIYVDNLTSTSSFSDEDLQFLAAFSGLAAAGIRNANYAEQVQREAMVRSNFERYFAPNVAAEIAQQQAAVKLGGDKRPITVLFSDIRGFTSMSEGMTPDAIAQLLTDYFTEMVDVIFEYGGTLDKFIGDAIMALWGAPIAHDRDPDQAMQAAITMQKAIASLNAKWSETGRPTVGVGIGINFGEVFCGNIGSHRRLEYTVIGDAVNVASRLCSKAGAGEILISHPFFDLLSDKPDVEKIDAIPLKGKAKPVAVYRLKI